MSLLQPESFSPRKQKNKRGVKDSSVFKTGLITPYQGQRFDRTLTEELGESQQERRVALDAQIADHNGRLEKYRKERAAVNERQQTLDDRYFKAISGVTQACIQTRVLENRDAVACDIITEPVEDLTTDESRIAQIERIVQSLEETLGRDRASDEEAVNDAELVAAQHLQNENTMRGHELSIRRLRAKYDANEKARVNLLFDARTDVCVPPPQDNVEEHDEAEDSRKIAETARRLQAVNEEIGRLNDAEEMDANDGERQQRDLDEKNRRIAELTGKVMEVEKHEFFISEMVYENGMLELDFQEMQHKKETIEEMLRKRGLGDDNFVENAMNKIREKEHELDQREAEAVERRKQLEEENAVVGQQVNELYGQYGGVEQAYAEMANRAAQATSMEDLSESIRNDVFGGKTTPATSVSSLEKIAELRRNLAMMNIDELSDDDGY